MMHLCLACYCGQWSLYGLRRTATTWRVGVGFALDAAAQAALELGDVAEAAERFAVVLAAER